MNAACPDTTASGIVAALEQMWAAIRARHPEVPEVVVAMASGSARKEVGHLVTSAWQRGDARLHEMFVSAEQLRRGPVRVLGTMLHEGAHAVAAARRVPDTSRQGRYHNGRYRAIAIELGLEVTHDPVHGWNNTVAPDITARAYRHELLRLDGAATAWRHPDPVRRNSRISSNNGLAVRCDCGRRIRVSETALSAGPIYCGLCQGEFRPRRQPPEKPAV